MAAAARHGVLGGRGVSLGSRRIRCRTPLTRAGDNSRTSAESEIFGALLDEHTNLPIAAQPSTTALPPQECLVEAGHVLRAHGLHGELHVRATTDFPEDRFCTPGQRWLRLPGGVVEAVELEGGRPGAGRRGEEGHWLVALHGVTTREEAEDLQGAVFLVDVNERPPLDAEDEFYAQDLLGLTAILQDTRAPIGEVVDVLDSGGGQLLQVELTGPDEGGRRVYVPFVREIVPVVDVAAGVVELEPPPGLLELGKRQGPTRKERMRERSRAYFRNRRQRRRQENSTKEQMSDGTTDGENSRPTCEQS
mmetsp:Transcript_1606/g.5540  ORF Transcript_1606/g.5540 Transcript_1606/m.5540 type:complete len:306 (-) Transcript_1606:1385-2302(-)